jgi:diacylglycerol kinase (ATP)
VGLGAAVTDEVRRRWRALPGRLRYMAGALRQLKRGHAYEIGLSLDGGEEARLPITTLALANGRYQGGGMHIAPRASMTDGLIDVTLIEHLSLTAALPHLHLLYTGGVYTHPKVRHYRARRVRIEGAPSTPVELDGDPLGVLPLEAGIAPGALQLLAPEGSSL